jgi:hypothetical protein
MDDEAHEVVTTKQGGGSGDRDDLHPKNPVDYAISVLPQPLASPSRQAPAAEHPKQQPLERFVIKFVSATDIPASTDFRPKVDPFLRAQIFVHQSYQLNNEQVMFKLQPISGIVCTPRRVDCNSAVWNCYRDFHIRPPEDAVLRVECVHGGADSDVILGKVDIPIVSLRDEELKTIYFVPTKVSCSVQFLLLFSFFTLSPTDY